MSKQDKNKHPKFLDVFRQKKMPTPKLQRIIPEPDLTEPEEPEISVDTLDENQFNEKFEQMLEDMNLTEEKKNPIRAMKFENKKQILVSHYKKASQENQSKFDKPADYIAYMGISDLSVNKLYACVESLRIALTNNPLTWVQEFGTNGLKSLLGILNECYRNDSKYDKIQYECIRCVRAIMNNTIGIKQVFSEKEPLMVLARSLTPNKPKVLLEAVQLLAAVCLIPPDGHDKAIEAITVAGEGIRHERFEPIVQGLLVKNNDNLRKSCMGLINAIVCQTDDLEYRLHLRNEIMRAGLCDLLEDLEKDASEELAIQVNIFNEHKEQDYSEWVEKFDATVRLELDDVNECFEMLKNLVMDSPSEPYFLSILQHLLFIRDDHLIRPAYYKLIEECVSQIVLHKGGCDPDFKANRRFQIDVAPLIETLVDKESKLEDEKKLEELKNRLEGTESEKQEAEAKLLQATKRIIELEQVIQSGGKQLPNSIIERSTMLNIPPPIISSTGGGGPPPPPMPGIGGPPAPPPPPMPGMGGPPAPPPPPGMGPPPPPMGGFMPVAKPPDVLPHGLKPKRKWETHGPIKRANWKTVAPQKLSEKSFWVRVQEEKLASPDILNGLSMKFSSKPASKRTDDDMDKAGTTTKKIKDLKVLDAKSGQNISILLGGSLKHISYMDVRTCILQCDTNVLTDHVLKQLIDYLPPSDQLNKLRLFKDQYNELTEAEQFAVTISDIKRLLPRLKSLSFRLHFAENVHQIKPEVVAGTAACQEIKRSNKFARILELILLMGNIMNSGSQNGQAFGFEISFLSKLTSTKDIENKGTLMHYLVETIERKFPELLTFYEELEHVDKASRVSLDTIEKTLRQMNTSLKNLETDLQNAKVPQNEDDKFFIVMNTFAVEARTQFGVLENMFNKMDTLYTDLAEFYAFDKKKYTLEEFFTDVKMFKDAFLQAHKDNLKIRENVEKIKRAKESREKQEQERIARAARKRALIDMNADQTQEGVMDSLLEALNSGTAFSRDQRRKKANPRVAGAERRAQLNRSRSRHGVLSNTLQAREILNEFS